MLWHHIDYAEERQLNGPPSYMNSGEIDQIYVYYKQLVEDGLQPTEIGVIAPYLCQVIYFNF